MSRSRMVSKVGLLSCSMALAVMVGCQPPAVVAPSGEGTIGNVKPGTVTAPTTQNGVTPVQAGTVGIDGAKSPGVPEPVITQDALGNAPVDKAKPMLIKAAEGGVYVTEDGLLSATIPPGALSQDAEVRFHRVDTNAMKNSTVFLNGIQFQMDLGDAVLLPNTSLKIVSKADDRMVGELKSMYADYDPARYALSQDAKGNWNVTMPVDGPRNSLTGAELGKTSPGPTRGLMTEDEVPLKPKLARGFVKESRIEAFCSYRPAPLPASYGDVSNTVTWLSDDPTLQPDPALPGNPAVAPGVRVVFGNLVKPPGFVDTEYKWLETIPAVAGTPAVFASDGTTVLVAATPGTPAVFGWVLQPAGGGALAADEFASGGYDCGGAADLAGGAGIGSCFGPFVVKKTKIIKPIAQGGPGPNVLVDSNGTATTSALKSYDSTRCNQNGCNGGWTYFHLESIAKYAYPAGAGSNLAGYPRALESAPSPQWDTTFYYATRPTVGPFPNLQLPKMSPWLKLNMTNVDHIPFIAASTPAADRFVVIEGKLLKRAGNVATGAVVSTTDLVVKFAIDPVAGATTSDLAIGRPLIVPDDDPRFLQISKIYNKALTLNVDLNDLNTALLQNRLIQRNGGYDIQVHMLSNGAK